jgi:acylphosphatase
MTQANIFFIGMVQGVGFRYTTQRIASDLKLVGWVRNLSDGRVEVLAQGSKPAIEQLMQRLADQFGGYIHNRTIEYEPLSEKFDNFRIIS